METIASPVAVSAVSVEMNEEEIIINGKSFLTAPTIRELTEIFRSTPNRHPTPYNRSHSDWIWDDIGIVANGKSEVNVKTIIVYFRPSDDISVRLTSVDDTAAVPDNEHLPANAFSGSLTIYGVNIGQSDSFKQLEQRLTPMNAEFRQKVAGGPTEIIKGNHICLQNHRPGCLPLSGQPSILFQLGSGVTFTFAGTAKLPARLEAMPDERVVGKTEAIRGLFDCIIPPLKFVKTVYPITTSFHATVSNRRLAIETGHTSEKFFQWSMNDLSDVAVRRNVVDALAKIPVDSHWLLPSGIIRTEELEEDDKPPHHVLEISTRTTGTTSFVFRRDFTLSALLDLEDCIKSAISRYRGKVPDLPLLEDKISAPNDGSGRSATAKEDKVSDKLVPCPRCTNQVSPEAVNCPFCGQPIAGGLFRINRGTREQTPKFVKVSRPVGWLLLILSGSGLLADILLGDGTHYVPWIIGACLSICFLVYVEVGQWWHQS